MTEKEKVVPGVVPRREGDGQPVIEPEIIEPEIIEPEVVEPEVVEPDDIGKEGQESRRPASWKTEFQRRFGIPPFPLTDEKLAGLVRRIDAWGPMQLGAFYPAMLRKECSLLLPQPVCGFWDWRYRFMLETWAQNSGFFRCAAIGGILNVYRMGECRNDYC